MAKIPFSKLNIKLKSEIREKEYQTSKGEVIKFEVLSYLPIKEKIEVISNIVNYSMDDNGFYNPIRLKIFTTLEIIYAYTNLTFSDSMKKDPFKLYDLLVQSNLYNDILSLIPEKEVEEIEDTVKIVVKNLYDYKNSFGGILELISNDYSSVDMDLSEIQKKINNEDTLSLIKEILPLTNASMD